MEVSISQNDVKQGVKIGKKCGEDLHGKSFCLCKMGGYGIYFYDLIKIQNRNTDVFLQYLTKIMTM